MHPALLIIIAITAIFSYRGFSDQAFFRKYEFHIGSIRAGEHLRMITSGFLHADFTHLIFNIADAVIFFAPVVIAYLGVMHFVIIYFGSLIFGSMLSLYFHKNDYYYRAIGASGAVTGVLYSAILLRPDMTLGLYFIIPVPAYLFGIGYLLYSIYGMKAKNDNIGHTAHFGGAIGGYIITISQVPSMLYENTLMVVLLALPIVLLFILEKTGKI